LDKLQLRDEIERAASDEGRSRARLIDATTKADMLVALRNIRFRG
jgi:hypothetical protein